MNDIQNWLHGLCVYNCIVVVRSHAFKVNSTLGVTSASADDISTYPQHEAPDWLIHEILGEP